MTKLSDTLTLTEQRDGWWLWDSTRGMNLAMRARTERDAFVEALTYYQRRMLIVDKDYKNLRANVDAFVAQVTDEEDYGL